MSNPNDTLIPIPTTPSTLIPLHLSGQHFHPSLSFPVISPLTNSPIHLSTACTPSEALLSISSASTAFPSWRSTPLPSRAKILLRAADLARSRRSDFRYFSLHETGSAEAYFSFDFETAVAALEATAGLLLSGSSALTGEVPTSLSEEGRRAMVLREPYGVVLAIAPWNAPCILNLRSFLGPIAAGNTVVLKGSERAPGCCWLWGEIFRAAGLPEGVLNTVIHRPEDAGEVVEAMIKAEEVRKVNFTGSTAVGRIVAGLAGRYLKPVLLELGGKAPAIVCEDADLGLAARECAVGAFLYSGQICMSTERILVNGKVVEEFRELLRAAIDEAFPEKEGLVLVSEAPVKKVGGLLGDAVGKGAKVLYGDVKDKRDLATAMRPVVVEGVKEGMDLYHTESFGPSVSLIVVENDEEAIKIANDTDYGLSSAVFTEDLRRGLRIARQIESGAVHINSMSVHDEPALPHGGVKNSGFGRFNGEEGLREWVKLKTITWKD